MRMHTLAAAAGLALASLLIVGGPAAAQGDIVAEREVNVFDVAAVDLQLCAGQGVPGVVEVVLPVVNTVSLGSCPGTTR